MKVVHIVQQISTGGAGQAIMAWLRADVNEHVVLSLVAPAWNVREGDVSGRLIGACGIEDVRAWCADADIVVIHWWNTPELYALLSDGFAARVVVLWSHVLGNTAPHILTDEVAGIADKCVSTAPVAWPHLANVDRVWIRAGIDLSRVMSDRNDAPDRAVIGTFGSLAQSKIDYRLAEIVAPLLSAAVRWAIVGTGDAVPLLRAMVCDLEVDDYVDFIGPVRDVGRHLRAMTVVVDVPSPDSSATCDLAIQEAMAAGVPVVTVKDSAGATLVRDEFTGFVCQSRDQVAQRVRELLENAALRAQMSDCARTYAAENFGAHVTAASFAGLFDDLSKNPLGAPHRWRSIRSEASGAARFVAAVGPTGENFRRSMAIAADSQSRNRQDQADAAIATSDAAMRGPGAGGVLHYRGYYPHDPFLLWWSALIHANSGNAGFAIADAMQARRFGLDEERVDIFVEEQRRLYESGQQVAR